VTAIFLDTVGLIALWDEADQWHGPAKLAYGSLRQARFIGVTTEAVLLECGNAAARRPYRRDVVELRERLSACRRLIALSDDDWRQAWMEFGEGHVGGPGIVDCASFVVMRRLGLTDAFTNDQHFRAAGFHPLF
jgi:predicted nucleic acid-binding protein